MKVFVVLCFLFSLSAYAESIQFDNITPPIVQKIKKSRPHYFNKSLLPHEIDDIIKILYQTEQFEKVRAYQKGSVIIFEASPLKKISEVDVTGNSSFSDSEILSSFGINPNDLLIQQSLVEGAEAIKELYGKSGYFNTIVSIIPEAEPNGDIKIKIQIQEDIPCKISEISFISENEDLKKKLISKLKKHLNDNFTEETVLKIEATLRDEFINQRLLSAVLKGPTIQYNDSKTSASLSYIIENPYSYVLFIEGEKTLSANEIINKLNINTDNQFGSNPTMELSNRIKVLYEGMGYPHITVSTKEKIHPKSFSRKVFFEINEGPRTKIKEIQIRGNISRHSSYYEEFIFNNSSSLVKNSYYNQSQIQKGIDNLLSDLQNQGFLQSKVLSIQSSFSDNKENVIVTVLLDEGPQTKISTISLMGLNAFSRKQILDVLMLAEGSPLQLGLVESSIQKLIQFYRSNGYMDMKVDNQGADLIKYNPSHTQAKIEFSISEGPQVVVGGIIIEGNQKTQDYVIIKELEFAVGDILTPSKISESEYSLQKTGLFSTVSITQLESGTPVSQRNLVVKVTERDPGLFNFGLGVNSEFDLTVRGYLGLSYKNLGGTARSISARLEVKRVTDIDFIDHRLVLGYFEPFVFNSKTRGRINLIRAREILSRTGGIKATENNKVQFLLEREFSRNYKLTWNFWSLSANREFEIPSYESLEDSVIGSIGPTFEIDYRNNPLVTTKGTYSKIDIEYSDPNLGSSKKDPNTGEKKNVSFIQTTGNFNWYVPSKFLKLVWANSVSGGYLSNLERKANEFVPDIKTFKLGGRDTIRGFMPLEIPGEFDKFGNEIRVFNNSHFYLLKSELRIPVVGEFESVFFYDGGSVNVSGFEMKDPYRDSAGLGIRYMTPAGPFRLEYGQKLDRDRTRNEDAYRIHISFGTF